MPKINKLITAKEIKIKLKDLVNLFLMENVEEKELNFIIVLEGAKRFANDFIKEILKLKKIKINKKMIKLSSYDGKTNGKIKVVKDINGIEWKKVFILEDIADSGKTINFLKSYLKKEKKVKKV